MAEMEETLNGGPKKGYNVALAVYDGNNAADMNQHLLETGMKPVLVPLKDFIAQTGYDPKIAKTVYENTVIPEFNRLMTKSFNPWETNKKFYQESTYTKAEGLPTYNVDTGGKVPVSQFNQLLGGDIYTNESSPSGKPFVIIDDIADNAGYARMLDGRKIPVSMLDKVNSHFKAVPTNDAREYEWQQMKAGEDPAGLVIRTMGGYRTAVGEMDPEHTLRRNAWDATKAMGAWAFGYGSRFISSFTDEEDPSKEENQLTKNLQLWANEYFATAKSLDGKAEDEKGLSSWRGAMHSLATVIPQQLPTIAATILTRGAAGMGLIGAELQALSKGSMQTSMLLMSVIAAGQATSQFEDFGMSKDDATFYGGLMGAIEYATENTLSANIMYRVGIKNYMDDVAEFSKEYLQEAAKAYGKATIKELPNEVKYKAVKQAWQKVKDKGISKYLIGLSEKGPLGKTLAAGGEEFIEEGLLTNLYSKPVEWMWNATKTNLSKATEDRYNGVEWIQDTENNKYYRVEKNGKEVELDEDRFVAEQQDYKLAKNINAGMSPFDGGDSWWKEGLLGGVSAMLTGLPMAVTQSYQKKSQDSKRAILVSNILNGHLTLDEAISTIEKMQFDRNFVDKDGKPITVPRSKVNQDELDEEKSKIDSTYISAINAEPNNENKAKLREEYKKALDDFQIKFDQSQSQVSVDELVKGQIIEELKRDVELVSKYKGLSPQLIQAIGGNINLLTETIKNYKKLETLENAYQELSDGGIKTKVENFLGNMSITEATTKEDLDSLKKAVTKNILDLSTPEDNSSKYSKKYKEIFNLFKTLDASLLLQAEMNVKSNMLKKVRDTETKKKRRETLDEFNKRLQTDEKLKTKYNQKLAEETKKIKNRNLSMDELMNVLYDTKEFSSPMNMFESFTNKLFGRHPSSYLGQYVTEYNNKIDKDADDFEGINNLAETTIAEVESALADVNKLVTIRQSQKPGSENKQSIDSNTLRNSKTIIENIKKIKEIINTGIGDFSTIKDSIDRLNKLQNDYIEAVKKAKSLSDEVENEILETGVPFDTDSTLFTDKFNEARTDELSDIAPVDKVERQKIDLNNISKEQEMELRKAALEKFFNRKIDNSNSIVEYMKAMINPDSNVDLNTRQFNILALYRELKNLRAYARLNKNVFQEQYTPEEEKEFSPLYKNSLAKITKDDMDTIEKFGNEIEKIYNEAILYFENTGISKDALQKKSKVTDVKFVINIVKDIETKINMLDKKFSKGASFVAIHKLVSEIEAALKTLGDNTSLDTLIEILSTSTNEEQIKKAEDVIDIVHAKKLEINNLISSLNTNGALDEIIKTIREKLDKSTTQYSYDIYNNSKAFNDNGTGLYSDNSYNSSERIQNFNLIEYLWMLKDCGLNGRKTYKEIYTIIENVQRDRQKDSAKNKVSSFHQEMLLVQALINFDRGAVKAEDNPTIDKSYFEKTKFIPFEWTFLVDGFPGAGKTTVFFQDYVAAANKLNKAKNPKAKNLRLLVVSPTEALLETYTENKELIKDSYDKEGYKQMTLDEFFNSDIDFANFDMVVFDEFSVITKKELFGVNQNSISDKLKSFNGQTLFFGDNGQVCVEKYTLEPDGSFTLSTISDVASTFIPAYATGERGIIPLQDSYRYGNIINSNFVDFIRSLTNKGVHRNIWGKKPFADSYGRLPIGKETNKSRVEANEASKVGIRISDESDVNESKNEILNDFINTFKELKKHNESTTVSNLMFIVKDYQALKEISTKIDKSNEITDVQKEELKALLKTAVRDDAMPSAFVSGLKSKNVFVFVDVSDIDYADNSKAIYMSRLLTAPVSRVITDGYMHVYLGGIDSTTYTKTPPVASLELPRYSSNDETPKQLAKKRDTYIKQLSLFTGQEVAETPIEEEQEEEIKEEETPGKQKTGKGKQKSQASQKMEMDSELRTLSLSEEQWNAVANLKAFKKLKEKSVADSIEKIGLLEATSETGSKTATLNRLLNILIFTKKSLLPKLSSDQIQKLDAKIDQLTKEYQAESGSEYKLSTRSIDYAFAYMIPRLIEKPTIIPYVFSGNHPISFLDVVGSRNGKLIVDVIRYKAENTNYTDAQKKEDALVAANFAKENNLIINQVRIYTLDNRPGVIDVVKERIVPESAMLYAQKQVAGTEIASIDDLYSAIKLDDGTSVYPIRTKDIVSVDAFELPKNINGEAYFLKKIKVFKSNGEVINNYILQNKKGEEVIYSEEEYKNAENFYTQKIEIFNEDALLFSQHKENSTSHTSTIAINGIVSPIATFVTNNKTGNSSPLNANNSYGRLRLKILSLMENNKTQVTKKYVADYKNTDGKFNHTVLNILDRSFFELNKTELEPLVKQLAKDANVSVEDYFDFISKNYLDVISQDFRPEYDYNDNKLSDEEINEYFNNKQDPYNKITFSSKEKDDFRESNINLNQQRLVTLKELKDEKEKRYSVSNVRFGGMRKKTKSSTMSDVSLILQNLKEDFGFDYEVSKVELKRWDKSKKVYYEVTLSSKDGFGFGDYVLNMNPKKATSSYVEGLIKELQENITLDEVLEATNSDKKSDIHEIFDRIDNTEAFQFIVNNSSVISKSPVLIDAIKSFLKYDSVGMVDISKTSINGKYQNLISILKTIQATIESNDKAMYNMAVRLRSDKVLDLDNLVERGGNNAINAPQVHTSFLSEIKPSEFTTNSEKEDFSKVPQPAHARSLKRGEKLEYEFSIDEHYDQDVVFSESAESINRIIESIIGSENMKKLKLDLRNNYNKNRSILGKFSVVSNVLNGTEYNIYLSGENGKFSEKVARHEAAHFVSILMLSEGQKRALEAEVASILKRQGKVVNNKNIYEYIADSYMNKANVNKLSFLGKFIALIKEFVSKFKDVNLKLAEFNYLMEKGFFQNKPIYDIEGETSYYKMIENDYNADGTEEILKQELFSESIIDSLVKRTIPAMFRTASPYSTDLSVYTTNMGEIMKYIESELLDYRTLVNKKGEKLKVTVRRTVNGESVSIEMLPEEINDSEDFYSLTKKDQGLVIATKLQKPNITKYLLQRAFYDINIEKVFKDGSYVAMMSLDNYSENERNNPDNMMNSIFKMVLSTIPLADYTMMKKDKARPFVDKLNRFVYYDYVDIILKNASTRLVEKSLPLTRQNYFAEIERMADEYTSSELKNAALSIYIEFGNYNGDKDIKTGEPFLKDKDSFFYIPRGMRFITSNFNTILEEMTTIIEDDGTVSKVSPSEQVMAKLQLSDTIKGLDNIIARIMVSAKSTTEAILTVVDKSRDKAVIREYTGSDIGKNYQKLRDNMTEKLYEENILRDDVVNSFVGDDKIYTVEYGVITATYKDGKKEILLDTKNKDQKKFTTSIMHLLSELGFENLSEEGVSNLLEKDSYAFTEFIYSSFANLSMASYLQHEYNTFTSESKEYLSMIERIDKLEETYVKTSEGEIDKHDPVNFETTSAINKIKRDIESFKMDFVKLMRTKMTKEQKATMNYIRDNMRNRPSADINFLPVTTDNQSGEKFIFIPSPLYNTFTLREISQKLVGFEINLRSGKIKDPNKNSRNKYSRTAPIDFILGTGNENESNGKLTQRIDRLMTEKVEGFFPLNSLKNNMFYKGTLDYDLLQNEIGIEGVYTGRGMGELSIKDFMSSWMYLFNNNFVKNKENAQFPMFFDNFSDKSRVPYINLFTAGFESPFDITVEYNRISNIRVKPKLIVDSFNQVISLYEERRERTIKEFGLLGINTTKGNTISDAKVEALLASNRLSENVDYFKDKKSGKYMFGPSITFDYKESIINKEFIDEWKVARDAADKLFAKTLKETKGSSNPAMEKQIYNGAYSELVAVAEKYLKSEMESLGKLLSDANFTFDSDFFYSNDTVQIEKNIGFYNDLFKTYIDKYKEKYPESTISYSQFEEDNTDDKKKKAEKKALRKQWKENLKKEFKEYADAIKKKRAEIDKQDNSLEILMKNNYIIDKEGISDVYDPIKAFTMIFHVANTQLQQLYKGDEYFYKNVTDFVKRAAGDVSPIDVFDTEALWGLEDTVRFIHVNDIAGFNSFIGETTMTPELQTDGYSIQFPWHRIQMINSAGGKAGVISDGVLKTTLKEYSLQTDKVTYLKFSQDHINKDKSENDPFMKMAMERVLKEVGDVSVNGKVFNLYDRYNLLIGQDWERGNQKFNELLFQTDELTNRKINHLLPGFIAFSSGFKTGQRGLNTLQEITDENGNKFYKFDETKPLTKIEVSSRNYGLQIIKQKPVDSDDKTVPTQNLRMYGLNVENDYSNRVNNTLSKILTQFDNEIIDKGLLPGNESFDSNINTFLKKLGEKSAYGSNISFKMAQLLKDETISLDVIKDKHIQNMLVYLNKYLNPPLQGNTYVQIPTQMLFAYDEAEGFYRKASKANGLSVSRKLRPTTYGFLNADGIFEEITLAEYNALPSESESPDVRTKKNLIVRPADIVMEFHKKDYFGISADMELSDVMTYGSFSMYDPFHKTVTLENRIKNIRDNILGGDAKLNDNTIERNEAIEYETLLNSFDKRLRRTFEYRINKALESKANEGKSKIDVAVATIAQYYDELNKSLWAFTDRIPHSGFNSAQLGRIVAFTSGQGNTIITSSEKNIFDGSDYDIDELHIFFYDVEPARGNNKIDKELKNELFTAIKDSYLNANNIPLFTMQIDLTRLREAAERMASKNTYVANGLYTRMIKMKQGYAGKEMTGHFVNIQNAISVLYGTKNLIGDELFEKFVSKDLRLLHNKEYIMNFLDLNQQFINAATDNNKEDGILGKLNISTGNTSMIAGLMMLMQSEDGVLPDPEKYDMLNFVVSHLSSEMVTRANIYYDSANSIVAGKKKEYGSAISEAYDDMKREIKKTKKELIAKTEDKEEVKTITNKVNAELKALEEEHDFLLKAIQAGEKLKSFYTFDFLGTIKPDEYTLNSKVREMETSLGISIPNFLANIKTYKEDGASEDINTTMINIAGLVANNNLLLGYVKSIHDSKNIIDNAFTSNQLPLKETYYETQKINKSKGLYEDEFNALNVEAERVVIGYFLDTAGTVTFNNYKFDMKIVSHRDALVKRSVEIVDYLKNKYSDNVFVSRLRTNKQKGNLPILEIANSKYYSPEIKKEYKEAFDKLDENDKDIIRNISVIVYGFNNVNGSITEFIDDKMERLYTKTVDSLKNSIINNKEELIKHMAVNNFLLQKQYNKLSDPNEGVANVITSDQKRGVGENKVYLNENGTIDSVYRTFQPKINSYSKSSLLNKSFPVARYIAYTKQNQIYDLKNGESISFLKPSSLFVSDKENTGGVEHGKIAVLENGVYGKITSNSKEITFQREGILNQEKSYKVKNTKAKNNIFDLRRSRIAGRFAEHVLSRLKSMFPNMDMELVTNESALNKDATGYVYNGKLYLNVDKLTADTPLHEIGHIITEVLKHSNRALYESLRIDALNELENNAELRKWIISKYSGLSEEDRLLEVISLMIGFNTEDRMSNFYSSIGKPNYINQGIVAKIKNAINSFINSVKYLLFGDVSLGKLDNIDNLTISELSEILIKAYMNSEKISDVNTFVLRDIMMLNKSDLRANIAEAKSLSDLIPSLMERDGLTKNLTEMDENNLINTIYHEAVNNNGMVKVGKVYDLTGLDLSKGGKETVWKKYIKENIIKDMTPTHDVFVGNIITWLNEEKGSLKNEILQGRFELDKEFDVNKSVYQKFLHAIDYTPNKRYVRYSDLKDIEEFKHIYDERLVGFNPVVAIEKIKGQKVISIYDVTPTMFSADTLNYGKKNILNGYIHNLTAHVYGIELKNTIPDVRKLYVQLLINHIGKTSGDIAIDNSSVIKFNRGESTTYLLDNIAIKNTIEGMRNVLPFFNALSDDLKEIISNPVKTVDVNYHQFLASFYETDPENNDKYQNDLLEELRLDEVNKPVIGKKILSRLNFLTKGEYAFLSIDKIEEIRLLLSTYRQLYGIKVKESQTNFDSIVRDLSMLIKPTMNIGQEDFMFVRDAITTASNEVVDRMIEIKDILHGNNKHRGIIRILQDNYKERNPEYSVAQYFKHNEYEVYKNMYAKVIDEDTKAERTTNVILWSTNAQDYIDAGFTNIKLAESFAEQARRHFGNNQEVLDQANKINDFVRDMLIERIKHNYFMKFGYQLSQEKAEQRLRENTNYKKGMIPIMNRKASENFYRDFNVGKSIQASAEEFAQNMTTFDSNFSEKRNSLGIISEINDMFMAQFQYSDSKKVNDMSTLSSGLGDIDYIYNNLGITKEIRNGEEVYITKNPEKNDAISLNLQTTLLYFAMTGVRKQVHEEKSLPVVNATMVLLNDLGANKDAKIVRDTEGLKTMVSLYADMMVFGRQTKNDTVTMTEKIYNTTNKILTPMAMLGNLSVPAVSAVTNFTNAFFNGLGATFFENGEPQLQHLLKASALFFNDFERVSQWAYKYQLINSSELESITHRFKGVVGEKYIMNQFISNLPNWGTDFYARAVSMVAHMLMEGSWDAHQIDKETGKAIYNENLDKRFEGDKGKILKEYFRDKLSTENGLNADGTFKRGHFFSSAKAMKAYADRKIIGAYSTDVKNVLSMWFLGKMFSKFSVWMFAAMDSMFGKGQWVREGGRVVLKDNGKGEFYAEWEQMYFEGWVRSYWELAKNTFKYKDIRAWSELKNAQKANIVKGAAILAVTTALAVITKLALDDDDKKKIKNKPFLALFYKTIVQSANSTLLFSEIYRKAKNPFALIGMSMNNFDNLYKMMFNSKGEPDFNYNNLQKVVRVLEITDYAGLTNEENN